MEAVQHEGLCSESSTVPQETTTHTPKPKREDTGSPFTHSSSALFQTQPTAWPGLWPSSSSPTWEKNRTQRKDGVSNPRSGIPIRCMLTAWDCVYECGHPAHCILMKWSSFDSIIAYRLYLCSCWTRIFFLYFLLVELSFSVAFSFYNANWKKKAITKIRKG